MRRLLIILSIIFLSAQYADAQSRNNPIPGSTEKILKFYPNPATSIITLYFVKSYQRGYMLQVFNFLGKPVFESPNVPTKTTLNLSDCHQITDEGLKYFPSNISTLNLSGCSKITKEAKQSLSLTIKRLI